MDQKDIDEFKDALKEMEIEEEKASSRYSEENEVMELYDHEATQPEEENSELKKENDVLVTTMETERDEKTKNHDIEQNVTLESIDFDLQSSRAASTRASDNLQTDQDDLESILSDEEDEFRTMIQENEVIKNALMNLKKEQEFWISNDTASETSDDADTMTSSRSFRDNAADKMQINKLLAEKEYLELKLSQVTHDKQDTEAKLRHLEKEAVRGKKNGDVTKDWTVSGAPSPLANTDNMRSNKDEDYPNKSVEKKSPKHKSKAKKRLHDSSAGNELDHPGFYYSKRRSSSPQFVKPYESDIAKLAAENAKLGEIIDHLHINPDETPSESLENFLSALESRVPKEEFLRLENEKIKLEHVLREKERLIKEKDRIIDEACCEYEEEIKILKESLRKAEDKLKEKGKLVNEYELKILDMKGSLSEQLHSLEMEFEMEHEQKKRLEQINVELSESSEKFHKEITELKSALSKLQEREKHIEVKYKENVFRLEEKLSIETNEKLQLSENLEGLVQDLMTLKNKLLEESERNGKLRKAFEDEIIRLGGVPITGTRRKRLSESLSREGTPSPTKEGYLGMSGEWEDQESRGRPYDRQNTEDYDQALEDEQRKRRELEHAHKELQNKYNDLISQTGFVNGSHVLNATQSMPDLSSTDGTGRPSANQLNSHQAEALKSKIDDLEEEAKYLKERLEDLSKERARRRELEEENEDLQDEISKMSRKRNELQRKQDALQGDIEEMNMKVKELEDNNKKLAGEVDELTNKIKEMENSFDAEKSNLKTELEREKESALQDLEKEKSRNAELQVTIGKLKAKTLNLKGDMEDDNNNNAMLGRANDVQGKQQMGRHRSLRPDEAVVTETAANVEQENDFELEPDLLDAQSTKRSNEQRINDFLDFDSERDHAKKPGSKEDSLDSVSQQDGNGEMFNERSMNAEGVLENENEDEQFPDASPHATYRDHSNHVKKQPRERAPDMKIEIELQQGLESTVAAVYPGTSQGEKAFGNLEQDKKELQKSLAEKQNEINTLKEEIKELESDLMQVKRQEQQAHEDKEKVEEELRDKLEENTRTYEKLLDDLKTRLESEKRELEEKLTKDSKELQRQMKAEFEDNLASKGAILENKIQDLVSEKAKVHGEEINNLEKQLETEKAKYDTQVSQLNNKLAETETNKDETVKKLEKEKKLLRVTIQALTKELEKTKHERKELKRSFKKSKAEMQSSWENERKDFNDSLERNKVVQRLKIEEELREKYRVEVEKYEEKFDALNDDLHSYEMKLQELQMKFKAEKTDLERELQESRNEVEGLLEQQEEFRESLAVEFQRKVRKEKENIESTLETLRQEIARLREHRKHLQSQIQVQGVRSDSGFGQGLDNLSKGNKEVISRLENEYQNQLKREKEYYEDKVQRLEADYEALAEEMVALKAKHRQERATMKAEFERERSAMEERLERERQELQQLLELKMQSHLRDTRRTVQVERNSAAAQRNRIFQNEVLMLQQKVGRLEELSPKLIDMAVANQTPQMTRQSQMMGNRYGQPQTMDNRIDQPKTMDDRYNFEGNGLRQSKREIPPTRFQETHPLQTNARGPQHYDYQGDEKADSQAFSNLVGSHSNDHVQVEYPPSYEEKDTDEQTSQREELKRDDAGEQMLEELPNLSEQLAGQHSNDQVEVEYPPSYEDDEEAGEEASQQEEPELKRANADGQTLEVLPDLSEQLAGPHSNDEAEVEYPPSYKDEEEAEEETSQREEPELKADDEGGQLEGLPDQSVEHGDEEIKEANEENMDNQAGQDKRTEESTLMDP